MRARAEQLTAQLRRRCEAVLQGHEGLHHLSGHGVRLADDAGLRHRRVLHEDALDLEGTDEVTGGLDHVIGAPDEPVVPVGIAAREIAGEIEAVGEALAIARGLFQ